jgi:hypothetical protein
VHLAQAGNFLERHEIRLIPVGVERELDHLLADGRIDPVRYGHLSLAGRNSAACRLRWRFRLGMPLDGVALRKVGLQAFPFVDVWTWEQPS